MANKTCTETFLLFLNYLTDPLITLLEMARCRIVAILNQTKNFSLLFCLSILKLLKKPCFLKNIFELHPKTQEKSGAKKDLGGNISTGPRI